MTKVADHADAVAGCRTSSRSTLVIVGVVLAVAATFGAWSSEAAGPRETTLRPGISVGKVHLGAPWAKVRAALGGPSRVERRTRYGFGEYLEFSWGPNRDWTVGVYRRSDETRRVVYVETTRFARTTEGVGVGSPEHALAGTLGARCRHYVPPRGFYERAGDALEGWCYLGSTTGPTTKFSLLARCSFDTGRYVLCPPDKRTYVAYAVALASPLGLRIFQTTPARSR